MIRLCLIDANSITFVRINFADPPFSFCNMPISSQRYSIVAGYSVKFSMLLEKVHNSSFKEPLDREIE
jgi:hypothetical protein